MSTKTRESKHIKFRFYKTYRLCVRNDVFSFLKFVLNIQEQIDNVCGEGYGQVLNCIWNQKTNFNFWMSLVNILKNSEYTCGGLSLWEREIRCVASPSPELLPLFLI